MRQITFNMMTWTLRTFNGSRSVHASAEHYIANPLGRQEIVWESQLNWLAAFNFSTCSGAM